MFCFDRFLPSFAFASWSLSFWCFLIKELYKEVVTVSNVLNGCYTYVETEPKWFYYFDYTNVANENCVKFCMEWVFKCTREEWSNEMKDGQNLKLEDAHSTPRYIQEVQASKLGDSQAIPIFINKTSGHFTGHYIFIASYIRCCSWSVSCFCFQFSLACFMYYLVGSQQYLFWRETHSVFIARTL